MKRKIIFYCLISALFIGVTLSGYSQVTNSIDYSLTAKEYIIRKLSVESPSAALNKQVVLSLSGLAEGQKIKIPGACRPHATLEPCH